MSTFRNPVGPRSSRVYWRRRLLVLFGLVAVIGVVVFLIVRPGTGDTANAPESSANETPAASESPAPSDGAQTPVEGAACDPAVVTVEAVTDTNAYPAGQLPQLSFRITNTSGAGCTYNVGSTQQQFVVTSGEEQYWSSKDCETEPVDSDMLLEPNVTQSSPPIPWDRTRSSVDTCDTTREPVPADGATYALTVTVGAVASEPVSFILN